MTAPRTPDELRDALFDAILRGDDDSLLALCNQYQAAIAQFFPTWTTVPPELRGDEQAVRVWAHCLMTLAELFDANGIPDLMERLTGRDDNPLLRWQDTYAQADALASSGRYEDSTRLLSSMLDELGGAQGSAVDEIRPKVYGLLGSNAFHVGDLGEAERLTGLALEDCRRSGDHDGVRTYTENIRVLHAAAAAEAGDEPSRRLLRIRAALARAQDLSDQARYDRSNSVLHDVLTEITAAADGPGADLRAKALGLLGLNHHRLGNHARAVEFTTAALDESRFRGDDHGVRVYTLNSNQLQSREA
jgi:hypothetical protein